MPRSGGGRDRGEAVPGGQGVLGNPVLSVQLCCEPRSALKKKGFKKWALVHMDMHGSSIQNRQGRDAPPAIGDDGKQHEVCRAAGVGSLVMNPNEALAPATTQGPDSTWALALYSALTTQHLPSPRWSSV